ncbi:hypothetical protein CIPAW_10G130100 [Carya illinoinensis]|uniref:Uncharacterized protein n=1 Tax=Carya illinoinensis TaxID=32201 RepID=A0A8T1P5I0_CARIL|nr:hypothetical protein CIPAW_10G130100 [Carya illinoinensis]
MNNNAYCTPRFAHFHNPHYHPAYPPISLCPTLFLPRPPLYSLLMTIPQATTEDSTQPSTRTVRVVVKRRVHGCSTGTGQWRIRSLVLIKPSVVK